MRTLRRFEEQSGDGLEQLAAGLASLDARLKKLEEGLAERTNSRVEEAYERRQRFLFGSPLGAACRRP